MKRFLNGFIGLLFICSTAHVVASAEEDLSKRLKAIETFSAAFTQIISDPSGEEIQSTSGLVQLKTPGLFYWQVNPPYEQLVVANQQFLWVYDADLEQVTISDRQKLDNSPAQILSGDFSSLGDQYSVTEKKQKGGNLYRLKALVDNNQTFTELLFEFNKQSLLTGMKLTDRLGQVTSVLFSEIKLNAGIADTVFEFGTPEGVDIIVNE